VRDDRGTREPTRESKTYGADPTAAERVLIVDDDVAVLSLHGRVLSSAGFEVETAANGDAAMAAVRQRSFDLILSDIDMPGMDGIRLLEQVRSYDADVPVILITGAPSMDTAIQALDRGALRYLTKPIKLPELVQVAGDAVRVHRLAIAKRHALAMVSGGPKFSGDQAALSVSFHRAVASIRLAYQPLVSWSTCRVVAYEALLRSFEPTLPTPGAVLDAAERLGRVHDVGRRVRELAIDATRQLPDGARLFVNVHPFDLHDDQLGAVGGALADVSSRITLEITERASLSSVEDARGRIRTLRDRGFQLALDDFGAGFGGLTSFALLEPDVVKLDMGLIRGIEREPVKQNIVKTMTQMCGELGILVIAEGVETAAERNEVVRAGCDVMQGFLFAKPAESFLSSAALAAIS
jgi:EAL domain-containing protein (putative c-di-GMP-specific phosphodiesterase class I)/ActR/RegA family two-component response regulator